MSGPREEDGDYAREFFDAYEREADRWYADARTPRRALFPIALDDQGFDGRGAAIARGFREGA